MVAFAQRQPPPKAEPVLSPGYYVGSKGDTVRGEIQVNPEDVTELYHKFSFKPAKGGKLMQVDPKKARAYGFNNRHFVMVPVDGEDVYLERLVTGKLNFFEFKRNGKNEQGYETVLADYFIQDSRANDPRLKEVKKLGARTYRADMEPYMKDQPMLWTDIDKYKFDKNAVINAIKEFNRFYATNGK